MASSRVLIFAVIGHNTFNTPEIFQVFTVFPVRTFQSCTILSLPSPPLLYEGKFFLQLVGLDKLSCPCISLVHSRVLFKELSSRTGSARDEIIVEWTNASHYMVRTGLQKSLKKHPVIEKSLKIEKLWDILERSLNNLLKAPWLKITFVKKMFSAKEW